MGDKKWLWIVALVGFTPCTVPLFSVKDDRTRFSLLISAFVSFLGFLATKAVIPTVKAATLRAGLFGMDINKKGSKAGEKKVPESLGLASGVVFLVGKGLAAGGGGGTSLHSAGWSYFKCFWLGSGQPHWNSSSAHS